MKHDDNSLKLRCEGCGQLLSVPSRKGTIEVTCPKCKRSFLYPSSKTKALLHSLSSNPFVKGANKLGDTIYKRALWAFVICLLAALLFSSVNGFLSYRRACDNIVSESEATALSLETALGSRELHQWEACFISGAEVRGKSPKAETPGAIYKEISDLTTKEWNQSGPRKKAKCSLEVSKQSGGKLQGRLLFRIEGGAPRQSIVLATYSVTLEVTKQNGVSGYVALIRKLTPIA